MGYHPDILVDESHAYLMSDLNFLKEKDLAEDITLVNKNLKDIFNKYFKAK